MQVRLGNPSKLTNLLEVDFTVDTQAAKWKSVAYDQTDETLSGTGVTMCLCFGGRVRAQRVFGAWAQRRASGLGLSFTTEHANITSR